MKSNRLLAVAALIGAAVSSAPASAGSIYVSYAGSADFGSGAVGFQTGSTAPNPDSSASLVGLNMGGIGFTTSDRSYDFSSTGQFNVWCIDIYHWMNQGSFTYQVGSAGELVGVLDAARSNGAGRVDSLLDLADAVYDSVDSKLESAAFQLAVWAISYGTADALGHYAVTTTDSGFRVDAGTAASAAALLANQWLNSLDSMEKSSSYTLAYLNDGSGNFTQDAIVFSKVPEPASLALLGIGLSALAIARRRRKS